MHYRLHTRFLLYKILFSELEQLLRSYIKDLAELEYHIERHSDISQLDRAYVTSVNIHKFRKLELSVTLTLSVIDNIQTQFFIQRFELAFQSITTYIIIL